MCKISALLQEYWKQVILNEVTPLAEFPDEDIYKLLRTFYKNKGPSGRLATTVNSLLTECKLVFSISAKSLDRLLKSDAAQVIKSVDGKAFSQFKANAMADPAWFIELVPPTPFDIKAGNERSGGAYRVVHPMLVDWITSKIGDEGVKLQEAAFWRNYNNPLNQSSPESSLDTDIGHDIGHAIGTVYSIPRTDINLTESITSSSLACVAIEEPESQINIVESELGPSPLIQETMSVPPQHLSPPSQTRISKLELMGVIETIAVSAERGERGIAVFEYLCDTYKNVKDVVTTKEILDAVFRTEGLNNDEFTVLQSNIRMLDIQN